MATAASTATMMSLPEDLIPEILVNLPVKSLLRFRCVCKSWSDLIETRSFIEMHLKHHSDSKNECILVVHSDEDRTKGYLSFLSLETLDRIPSSPILEIPLLEFGSLDVCGPCNGLICASDDTNIVLCNPSKNEFKLLPLSPAHTTMYPEGTKITRLSIGFGFDSCKNDFKVVTFVYESYIDKEDGNRRSNIFIEIYRLGTNSWKQYGIDNLLQYVYRGHCGTLHDGSFYWLAFILHHLCILSYNMRDEEMIYMPLPDVLYDSNNVFDKYGRRIRVINDSLALLIYKPYIHQTIRVEVWEGDGFDVPRSFTKVLEFGPLTGIREPLSIWKDKALLIDSEEGQLVSYDNEFTRYNIHGGIAHTMVYKESLVSLRNKLTSVFLLLK